MATKRTHLVCRYCHKNTINLRDVGTRRIFLMCETCSKDDNYAKGTPWTDEQGELIRGAKNASHKRKKDLIVKEYPGDIYITKHVGKDGFALDPEGRVYQDGVSVGLYHQVMRSSVEEPNVKSQYVDKVWREKYPDTADEGLYVFLNYRDIHNHEDQRIGPLSQDEYEGLLTEDYKKQEATA